MRTQKDRRTIPSPPALLTAEASSAYPTHCIPPWMTGTRQNNISYSVIFQGHARKILCIPEMPSVLVNAVLKGMFAGRLFLYSSIIFRKRKKLVDKKGKILSNAGAFRRCNGPILRVPRFGVRCFASDAFHPANQSGRLLVGYRCVYGSYTVVSFLCEGLDEPSALLPTISFRYGWPG